MFLFLTTKLAITMYYLKKTIKLLLFTFAIFYSSMIKLLPNFFCNCGEQSNLQVSIEKCRKTANLIILIFQELRNDRSYLCQSISVKSSELLAFNNHLEMELHVSWLS